MNRLIPEMSNDLGALIAAYRAGKLGETVKIGLALWEQTASPQVAVVLSLVALDSGDRSEAIRWLELAVRAQPDSAPLRHQLGILLLEASDFSKSECQLKRALQIDEMRGGTWLALGRCQLGLGKIDDALSALRRSASFPGTRDEATQLFLYSLPIDDMHARSPSRALSFAAAREFISIVMCTVSEVKVARAISSYAAALGDWPHEFVVVRDPVSLAAGYNEGLARANGPVVVFSHDDVEILCDDLGARLAGLMHNSDIVGVAGATKALGPVWNQAGHPFLHGSVTYPAATGYEITVYSVEGPLVLGAETLDGLFIATRKRIAGEVGWDDEAFGGFHGYDIDFTLRAARAGWRVAIATDLPVLHRSKGNFGQAWRDSAAALTTKFPELGQAQRGASHFFTRTVASVGEVRALYRSLSRTYANR